ncbi:TPR repeat-containing thioredoxin TTL1-like [Asparagus officinalis]|uniref:TPR repeat-containing thioredoxin TTL1-like n=1 Tax=Asparagus officinalis TaxID=4686 RepID=UPI00098E3CE2|nr:TPR repeat-containing thioredoxin TTL1-like [Asparagus officinalis]XP_020275958.1 TPR repeat-containing thioredoxin TTL1-like [Asparagus officinalis]
MGCCFFFPSHALHGEASRDRYCDMNKKKKKKKKKKCLASCCCCFSRSSHRTCPPLPTNDQDEVAKAIISTKSPDFKQVESDEAKLLIPVIPKPPSYPPLSYNKVQGKDGTSKKPGGMIREGRRSKKRNNLIRASSSNIMLFGNLGNVKGHRTASIGRDLLDYLPKTAMELSAEADAKKKVAAKENEGVSQKEPEELDAEGLKEKGNEEYKNGRFTEAVAFYERAITKDPSKASYWSNKAAAFLGLGQLLEAVTDCKEAVRIDPAYGRAHYRLATLYIRLGNAEKAIDHYKLSQNETSADDMSKAQALQSHLSMSEDARRLKDWSSLLKLAQDAISAGADSSPQVFASQAEALLNLHRHEEADAVLASLPKFNIDASTKFFGAASNAYFFGVRAQVHMEAGRFEDAVIAAEKAAQLDPDNKVLGSLAQKALTVMSAQVKGNDLFKASKFSEACVAYGEGLDEEPYNPILLFNRAACRAKLGQWEKVIEDCDNVLKFHPAQIKARLRRADCNAKLERWGASVEDYEILLRQMPGDDEVVKALFEAHLHLTKQPGEKVKDSENDAGLMTITSENQLMNIIMLPGIYVALFFNKSSEASENLFPSMEGTLKKFTSVKFLKVDIEECPSLAKSENISTTPAFKIYKNGSNVKDIAGSDFNQLEHYIKSFET